MTAVIKYSPAHCTFAPARETTRILTLLFPSALALRNREIKQKKNNKFNLKCDRTEEVPHAISFIWGKRLESVILFRLYEGNYAGNITDIKEHSC